METHSLITDDIPAIVQQVAVVIPSESHPPSASAAPTNATWMTIASHLSDPQEDSSNPLSHLATPHHSPMQRSVYYQLAAQPADQVTTY